MPVLITAAYIDSNGMFYLYRSDEKVAHSSIDLTQLNIVLENECQAPEETSIKEIGFERITLNKLIRKIDDPSLAQTVARFVKGKK